MLHSGQAARVASSSTPQLTQYDMVTLSSPVGFDFDVDSVLHQLLEEISLHISFLDAAGEVDHELIPLAHDRAVGTFGKRLS